jgi:hypothetical protein
MLLNASATEIRSLALPEHLLRIVALDGNPVPTQVEVAERVSALVDEASRPCPRPKA